MGIGKSILVLGATGRTGRHLVQIALERNHQVRVLVRDPNKLSPEHAGLVIHRGSMTTYEDLDGLLDGVACVFMMVGDAEAQRRSNINADFLRRLVPAMRRQGVTKLLYQAGAATRPYDRGLPFLTWIFKATFVRFGGLLGQHRDNEAVIKHLVEHAKDIDWVVHRAGIGSDEPSKGRLVRSRSRISLATHFDCADYNYRIMSDPTAVHTYDVSCYAPR